MPPQGELRAAAGERDLEGRLRLFRAGARPDPATVTRYLEERREAFGVEPICRAIGVPVSTHYARRSRKPSRRELRDRELLVEIEAARSGRRRPRPGRPRDARASLRVFLCIGGWLGVVGDAVSEEDA